MGGMFPKHHAIFPDGLSNFSVNDLTPLLSPAAAAALGDSQQFM